MVIKLSNERSTNSRTFFVNRIEKGIGNILYALECPVCET